MSVTFKFRALMIEITIYRLAPKLTKRAGFHARTAIGVDDYGDWKSVSISVRILNILTDFFWYIHSIYIFVYKKDVSAVSNGVF